MVYNYLGIVGNKVGCRVGDTELEIIAEAGDDDGLQIYTNKLSSRMIHSNINYSN